MATPVFRRAEQIALDESPGSVHASLARLREALDKLKAEGVGEISWARKDALENACRAAKDIARSLD